MVGNTLPIAIVSSVVALGIFFGVRMTIRELVWWKLLTVALVAAAAGAFVYKVIVSNV